MDYLHKEPVPSNEIFTSLANFMDNYFTDAVSFPAANTLKFLYRDLRTMYLSKQCKNIFRNISLVSHSGRGIGIFFCSTLYQLQRLLVKKKKKRLFLRNKLWVIFLTGINCCSFTDLSYYLQFYLSGREFHVFLVSPNIILFHLSFSRALIIRC